MSQLDAKEESGKLKDGETGGCKQGVMVCWSLQSSIYCAKHGWLNEKEYHKRHSLCKDDDDDDPRNKSAANLSVYDETIAPFLEQDDDDDSDDIKPGKGSNLVMTKRSGTSRKLKFKKEEEEEEEVEGEGEFLEIEQFFNSQRTPEKDGLQIATDELENLIPKIQDSIEHVRNVSSSRRRSIDSSPTKFEMGNSLPSPIRSSGNLFRASPTRSNKYSSEKRNRGDESGSRKKSPSPARKNEILFEERISSFKKRYISNLNVSFWNQKELGILRQTLIFQKKSMHPRTSIKVDKLQIFHPDTGAFINLDNEIQPTQPHIKSPLFSRVLYYSKRWYSRIKKFRKEFKKQYLEQMEYTKNFTFSDPHLSLRKMNRHIQRGGKDGFFYLIPTRLEEVKFDLLNEIGVVYVVLVYTLGREFVFVGSGDLGVKFQWVEGGKKNKNMSHFHRIMYKPERLFELLMVHCGLEDVYVFVVGDYRMEKICSEKYWIRKFRRLSGKYNETVVVNEEIGSEEELVYKFKLEE